MVVVWKSLHLSHASSDLGSGYRIVDDVWQSLENVMDVVNQNVLCSVRYAVEVSMEQANSCCDDVRNPWQGNSDQPEHFVGQHKQGH